MTCGFWEKRKWGWGLGARDQGNTTREPAACGGSASHKLSTWEFHSTPSCRRSCTVDVDTPVDGRLQAAGRAAAGRRSPYARRRTGGGGRRTGCRPRRHGAADERRQIGPCVLEERYDTGAVDGHGFGRRTVDELAAAIHGPK